MNRYLFLAAAAASVAVTGPLPDLQWQNNNGLVDFVPELPSALSQDALGLNIPALKNAPWMIAGNPPEMPPDNEPNPQQPPEIEVPPDNKPNLERPTPHNDKFNIRPLPNSNGGEASPYLLIPHTTTDTWTLTSFECKAQASVCCSQENRLGPAFIQTPSSTKSCAASMFHPNSFLSPFRN